MGELVVDMFMSLDGVIQAPGGPDEDRESGFDQGGWQAPYVDEVSDAIMGDNIAHLDALLLGRKTYDIFAAYWPHASRELAIAEKLNSAPKYVASRSLRTVEWNNSKLLEGDVPEAIARIKQEHEEIHVIGSANLVQTMLQHDLVDRFNLWVYPLLLGSGKRLFEDGTIPTALRLAQSATFGTGAVLLVYQHAGKPTYGDMT